MNKTININLGGVFFHIDEIAFKKLKKYLEAIRRSLSDDPKGKDEILTDIETRIGEILAENIKDVRQVVNDQDIEDIIEIMGKPEDYVGDEEYFEEHTTSSHASKNTKKLYRDTNDKFLGGVSSGLAHYFNIDVIWVRLAWLLMFFGGGVGGVIYIILWILLPQANSTAEKLEMEGEPVNISNIEKKIREEFKDASQRVKEGIDDVASHLKKKDYKGKMQSGSQDIVSLFGKIFTVFFKVIGKFIGIILMFVAGITLIALLITLFTAGSVEFLGISNDFINYPDFFHESTFPLWLLTLFFIIAFGIPFLILFMLGIRIISSNVKPFSRTVNLTLLGIWLVSLLGFVFVVIEKGANFANEARIVETKNIKANNIDTLHVKMIAKEDFDLHRNSFDNIKVIHNNREMNYKTNIQLDIKESKDDKMYLKIYKKSYGISYENAKLKAEEMSYEFEVIDDKLILNAYYLNELKNKFSNQRIKIVLHVPKNKTIYLDKSTKMFLHYVDNIQDVRDRNMPKHYYKMTEKGLNCLDCERSTNDQEKDDDEIETKAEKSKTTTEEKEVTIDAEIKETKIDSVKTTRVNKHVKVSKNGLEID